MALERRRVYVNEFWYLISKESSPASIVGFKCVPYPSSRIIFYVEQICLNSTCKKLLFLWLILCKLFKMRIFTIDTQVNGNIQITKHKRQPLGLQANHHVEVELNEQTMHILILTLKKSTQRYHCRSATHSSARSRSLPAAGACSMVVLGNPSNVHAPSAAGLQVDSSPASWAYHRYEPSEIWPHRFRLSGTLRGQGQLIF